MIEKIVYKDYQQPILLLLKRRSAMGVVEKISWKLKLEATRAVGFRYAGNEESVDSIQIHMIVRHV